MNIIKMNKLVIIGAKPPYFEVHLSVCLSVYVGLTIIKVNKLLTLIAGFAPSMFFTFS